MIIKGIRMDDFFVCKYSAQRRLHATMNASAKKFFLLIICCAVMTVALAMPKPNSDSAQLFRETRQVRHPLGAPQCTWGPSYWCSSPQATAECNAHAYCSTHMMVNWP